MAKTKPVFSGKIHAVTSMGTGVYSVTIEQDGETFEYILRDNDPHGIAPYLREVIGTMIDLGQLKILTGE